MDLMEARRRILLDTPYLENATGNPVIFSKGESALLKNPVVSFKPRQNITRKNLLSSYKIAGLRHDTYTHNGITYIANEDGSVTANGTCNSSDSYWSVSFSLPPGNYYYTYGDLRGEDGPLRQGIVWESGDGVSRRARRWDGVSQSNPYDAFSTGLVEQIKINAGCTYIIRVRVGGNGFAVNNFVFYPMIVSADELDYSFEPYKLPTPDTPYPITGLTELTISNNNDIVDTTSLGSTVYGGTLDYDTGVFTATHAVGVIDQNKSITTIQTVGDLTRFWSTIGHNHNHQESVNGGLWCDCLPVEAATYSNSAIGLGYSASYTGSVWIKLPTSLVGTTAASIKAYLTSHPITIADVLATPVATQLTPKQLRSLRGANNIATNGDTISCKYWTH